MAGMHSAAALEQRVAPVARGRRADTWGWLALAVLVIVYAGVALTHLEGYRWNLDEGLNVSLAWDVLDGYPLYREAWSDQPPGYIIWLVWAFRAFGVTLAAARGVTVLTALVGLVAVAWGARELLLAQGHRSGTAWLGGLAAALILAIAPNFWWASRAAMIGLPTFCLATLALAFALRYARTGGSGWILGSGLALGLSLWIKLQMVYVLPLLALLVLWQRGLRSRPALGAALRDLALLGLTSLGPLALCLVVYDRTAFMQQVVWTYFATRTAYPVNVDDNLRTFWVWLSADNGGLAMLALCGVVALLFRRSLAGWLTLTWGALVIVTSLQHAPLFLEDHFEPLLLLLCILAGIAVGQVVTLWLEGTQTTPWSLQRLGLPLLGLIGLVVYGASLGHVLAVDQSIVIARDYDNEGDVETLDEPTRALLLYGNADVQAALAFIEAHSRPNDFVVVDDPILAFQARRRLPPGIAILHSRRVHIGAVTADDLIEQTGRYEAPVVVTWKSSLTHFKPYMAWLAEHYDLVAGGDEAHGWRGYVRRAGQ